MSNRVLKIVGFLGALNFGAFLAVDFILGGDALNGKVEGGRYYLGNHGTFTEVSHAVFIYSACHACSGIPSLVLAGIIGHRYIGGRANSN
jgi:hypothetical protein